jgi:alpha-ketoglutarate-dependent taurine dioxygenase
MKQQEELMSELRCATRLSVVPSGKPVGAEVRGVDLSRQLDEASLEAIRDAVDTHGMI